MKAKAKVSFRDDEVENTTRIKEDEFEVSEERYKDLLKKGLIYGNKKEKSEQTSNKENNKEEE